jgi:hypothetical protein
LLERWERYRRDRREDRKKMGKRIGEKMGNKMGEKMGKKQHFGNNKGYIKASLQTFSRRRYPRYLVMEKELQ